MAESPVREALDQATHRLREAGVPTPEVDAELLLGHILGLSRGALAARAIAGAVLAATELRAFHELVDRRVAREPLQHITGVAHFRHLTLAVGPGVFVPRPETELLAQLGIDALLAVPVAQPLAVDLGTGSGAVAIALATEVPHARVHAVELSPAALAWAERNARDSGAMNLTVVRGDLRDALPALDGQVHVVVSNPPYIPTGAVPRDPEVRLHDPELALYGGADGLELIRPLAETGYRLLVPGGLLAIEHGELQGGAIQALLASGGWRALATHSDLSGRPRVTTAVHP